MLNALSQRHPTLRRYVVGLLVGVAMAAGAPAAVAQEQPPPPIQYDQIPLHADRQYANGAADDARIQRLFTRRLGGNVAVFVYRSCPTCAVHSIAMDSMPQFWRVPAGITKGHAEARVVDFLRRAGIPPEWVFDAYSEHEPCVLQPSACKLNIFTRDRFPNLERVSYSLPYAADKAERRASVATLRSANQQLLKEYDAARTIMNPGGGRGGGALPLNLARPLGPGGIDFSTLELRHVADSGGGGIRYSFSGQPTAGVSDPATGMQNAKQSSDAFFTWLALPPQADWVNLNPNEPDRLFDPQLGRTDVGRVLLTADLAMKKAFARAMHPDTPTGAEYWREFDNLYDNQPDANYCFSFRQEIVPAPATVRDTGDDLYILDAPLKIDAVAQYYPGYTPCSEQEALDPRKLEIYRRLIVPVVEKAINTEPEFEALRRVYLARVAAEWFRQRSTQHKTAVSGIVNSDNVDPWALNPPWDPTPVFNEMVRSLTQGEFNIPVQKQTGGVTWTRIYSFGGVDFSQTPRQNISAQQFKASYPKLARQADRAQHEPTTVGNQVWVGGDDASSPASGRMRLRMTTRKRHVRVGQLVRYRLAVTNPTDETARNVRVCDRLPARVGFVRASDRRRLRHGRQCWDIDQLGAAGTRTIAVTARVLNGTRGRARSTATASVRGSRAVAHARRTVRVVGGTVARPGGVTG